MGERLVSIIMPIYNAEIYLNISINSVLKQTYNNIELILIDDGSTDNSLKICEKYASRDNRVKLFSQENKGVVATRKKGICEATGDFVAWVDADDWIEADYIEQLMTLQNESKAQIVAVAHYHDIGNNSVKVKNGIKNGVYDVDGLIDTMLYNGKFYEYGIGPHLYTKLFDTEIIKEAQRDIPENIFAGDDAAITYTSILKCCKIHISDIAGYHYVQNPGSITKVEYSNEYSRVQELIEYLESTFKKNKVWNRTQRQLQIYKNYLLILRQVEVFDKDGTNILTPYGGIKSTDKVIIYGAGVLGQKIYKYLNGKKINIVAWLDKNSDTYKAKGYNVGNASMIGKLGGEYDYILIANITENVACAIKKFLLDESVPIQKIRWFTEDFRYGIDIK